MSEYIDNRVFGVPLAVNLQRSGHALPKAIQAAMKWLRVNALDQEELFRKSGVLNRIARLKATLDKSPDCDSLELYEGQQPYDVADMIKLYFRDLPESLLTSKAKNFITIFQGKWSLLISTNETVQQLKIQSNPFSQIGSVSRAYFRFGPRFSYCPTRTGKCCIRCCYSSPKWRSILWPTRCPLLTWR